MIRYATRLPPGKPVELISDSIIRKTEHFGMQESATMMEAILKHFITHPDPMVVQVYNYDIINYKKHDYVISYDMMRCGLLEPDEKDLVNRVGDLWDRFGTKACCQDDNQLNVGKQNFPELFSFLKKVVEQGRYLDLHSGNVMRDIDENYVLIDLEGFIRFPFSDHRNDWMRDDGSF